jgi:hypothetical protein
MESDAMDVDLSGCEDSSLANDHETAVTQLAEEYAARRRLVGQLHEAQRRRDNLQVRFELTTIIQSGLQIDTSAKMLRA